ncbi:MAG: hypothetical protein RLZZ535_3442, partial [Cyanobacteriota bacterium]
MTTNIEATNSAEMIELTPDFKLPVVLILIAVGFSRVSLWLAGAIAILGLFLTIQTFLIRLQFTDQ